MALLQVFCTEIELNDFMVDLAIRHDLMGCIDGQQGERIYDPLDKPSMYLRSRKWSKVYLFPRAQTLPATFSLEAAVPRNDGWIDIWPGQLSEQCNPRVLTMTTIQASDTRGLNFKPATWLRRSRKRLAASMYFGVDALNVVSHATDSYDDIGYSQEALRLWDCGVVWKQYKDANVEFRPRVR